MNLHAALEFLKELAWRTDDFIVFGSAPLSIRGIRDANDVDVVVVPQLWQRLSLVHPSTLLPSGVRQLRIGPVEVLNSWWPYVGNPEEIVASGEMIDGLPFAPIELVLRWKRLCSRPKDLTDCRLIEAYLQRSQATAGRYCEAAKHPR